MADNNEKRTSVDEEHQTNANSHNTKVSVISGVGSNRHYK